MSEALPLLVFRRICGTVDFVTVVSNVIFLCLLLFIGDLIPTLSIRVMRLRLGATRIITLFKLFALCLLSTRTLRETAYIAVFSYCRASADYSLSLQEESKLLP